MVARNRQSFPSHEELFPSEEFLGDAVEKLKTAPAEQRGAVYTRPEVVDFMLDLAGYTPEQPLAAMRLLEPSFGGGDFLQSAVRRLFESAQREQRPLESLGNCIRAVELHTKTFERTRGELLKWLLGNGVIQAVADRLLGQWLINGDFLLEPMEGCFDLVAGNPPYVRQELIPPGLLAEYRQRYSTLYDRADLYVPFMERSLGLLNEKGRMCFICSDRWMKNRYGGPLRALISSEYSLRYYVDMVGTDAFQSGVTAYPAITVIERGRAGEKPLLAHRPKVSGPALRELRQIFQGPASARNGTVSVLERSPDGDDPWLLESDAQPSLDLVWRLEKALPTLEAAGCCIGIGVATGADKAFIGPYEELDVEDARKLPLVMTRDILAGQVHWRGFGVVNPFEEDGSLADARLYPRFSRWLERHRDVLMKRHCARKAGSGWYRTIDRITPSLSGKPKLLIPDIKGGANIVLEEGRLYPHHNLYYITSERWPLKALQAVLKCGIARLFVRAYSTKMRGGCLRFQAQYLRRIRIPHWHDVPASAREWLESFEGDSLDDGLLKLVAQIYQIPPEEILHLPS